MSDSLYIIDASGVVYRAYFAIRNMTNDKGESTNALFGFIRSLLKLFKEKNPNHLVAVFDGPKNSSSRLALYKEYKATRAEMPQDLRHQITWAKEFCDLYGIPTLSLEGVEADDTMGSVALFASRHEKKVYLCSTDKDLAQLVSESVFLLDMFKENQILGPSEVKEKFGVPPEQIVDYLALIGDSSDNVPGVSGIGPKGAQELLAQYGSLENLLQHVDDLKGKKREILLKEKEMARLSRRLVTLDLKLDIPLEMAFYAKRGEDLAGLKEFYSAMRFNSLLKEIKEPSNAESQEQRANYHLVESKEALNTLLETLAKSPMIALDTETTSLDPMLAELVGIGLGITSGEAFYIPFNGSIDKESLKECLRDFFGNPSLHFFGHNIKYDMHVLENAGMPVKNVVFDTMIASYLLNSHTRRHSLDDLSLELFHFVKTPTSDLIGKGKNQITMDMVDIAKVKDYCSEDIDYTIRLKDLFLPELKKRALENVFYKIEMPLLPILEKMEKIGIFCDKDKLKEVGKELEHELERRSFEIFQVVGETFNLNSPLQISQILFEKLGIPQKRGASTSAEVLEELKWEYPIAGMIQEYRGLEKLRSTYVDTLPLCINPKTGRIHCTFNQSVAATGRLSSQDPNLQNIPVRSPMGLKIREAFRPENPSSSFISADYSQVELRLLAHFSEDPVLIDAFSRGDDIHTHTAATVFHVPQDAVTKEMRSKAKAVNFGIIYGQGAFGLSQQLGISQKEAAEFIRSYFHQYPKVKTFLESCKDQARLHGKAVTITGRERLLPEILSKNTQIRNQAERLSVNTPFQGSSADVIKMAMIEIDQALKGFKGVMILQIHDELIFEVPDSEVEEISSLVKNKMESVFPLKVPLVVDVEVGKNWKEC